MRPSKTKCKIKIVKLGHMKRYIDTKVISKLKSNLFDVIAIDEKPCITNNNSDEWQTLSDSQALNSVSHDGQSDITVAITEYALENNFYLRGISNEVSVLSLFEVGDLIQYNNIPIENFIAINLYKIVALSNIYKKILPTSECIPDIFHDETRSCLFDINGLKTDVIYSTARPTICQPCQAVMMENQLPHNFLNNIRKELKNIRIPMYYRLQGYIKKRPLISIGIMVASAFVIEILANLAYEFISQIWKSPP